MDLDALEPGTQLVGATVEADGATTRELLRVDLDDCTISGWHVDRLAITSCRLTSCTLRNCTLTMATFIDTSLRGTRFERCKLTGADFSTATWSSFTTAAPNVFEECDLSYANFASTQLGPVTFTRCKLSDASFGGAELPAATFDDCDLTGADFLRADISRADFTTSHSFTIDPTSTKLRGARFSRHGLVGLVQTFGIEID